MREGSAGAHLVARAGRKLLALALADVAEIMRPLPVARLGGAPAFVLGGGVIRGTAVPVIDACALLEAEASARPAARWISLRVGSRRAALAVDEVIGTRTFGEADLDVMPPLLQGVASGVATSIATLDDRLVLVLRAGRIVPEAVWETLQDVRRS